MRDQFRQKVRGTSGELANPENNTCFGRVIGRHLHFDLVTDNQTDETLTHFTRNMGEDFMAARKGYLEHGASKD